ncbi:unnamed protein product [Didymodactylos carnosus]|uniref:NAD(P)(+)--arginine ADP-ribosyltransferase n=1 Tax=Didymodactylos carnosus TaxID=1234261 RepID=A0A815KCU7_9BILA|nr:unnamed protein product [Didymodactylos carnosus]CAF4288273.1 unnamed protein product [Didymodactylos carnosus]
MALKPADTHQRFTDVQYEPNKLLLPVSGYQNTPLVSLEQAIEPVKDLIDEDVSTKVYIAKRNCKTPKDGLTQDESASIQLYTMECDEHEQSLYYVLNKTLRMEDRKKLTVWFYYLKLLLTALWKLPCEKKIIYRGVNGNSSENFNFGDDVAWWGFSSCTESLNVLEAEEFLGKSGVRTLFNIECCNGKVIRNHSFYKAEDEVLLMPATQMVVVGKVSPAPGLYIIQMRELENPTVILLKPPFSKETGTPIHKSFQPKLSVTEPKAQAASDAEKAKKDRTDDKQTSTHYKPKQEDAVIVETKEISKQAKELVTKLKLNMTGPYLYLNHFENLSIKDAQAIADGIRVTTSAQHMYWMKPNKLSRESMVCVLEALKINHSIVSLTMSGGEIPDWLEIILEILLVNKTLKHLSIIEGAIKNDNQVKLIANALKEKKILTNLDLEKNQISDEGIGYLSELLNVNKRLKVVL